MCKNGSEQRRDEPDLAPSDTPPIIPSSYDTTAWPEDNKTCSILQFFQNWTYGYMNTVLEKGSQQKKTGHHLVEDDLFAAPAHMRSTVLADTLRQHLQEHNEQSPVQRLVRALWAVARPTFVPAGVCEFVALSCQVALPLLVRELLQLLEANPRTNVARQGIGCKYRYVSTEKSLVRVFSPFCFLGFVHISRGTWPLLLYVLRQLFPSYASHFPAGFTLSPCTILGLNLNAFCNHRHRHLAMKSGIAMRAAAVNVMYDHVLHLAPEGKVGLTSGEVTNLIATGTLHGVYSCSY